ncbi:MAG: phosphate signaling complex protein PhoU [Deltaproteobacteria bacterium]|nr:phosphate signaling complex protein PhoU [Deltaproteobacteria bacterium]
MPAQHTDRAFEEELRLLRDRLLLMAGRVEEMIDGAMRALVDRDSDIARQVIKQDAAVNGDEVAIDDQCWRILARRQPMGVDLRFLLQTHKMVGELERVGDLAVNIAERAIDLNAAEPLKPYHDIPKMGELVQSMVRDAIDALVNTDPQLANNVIDRDDEVDDLYDEIFADLLELMVADPQLVERGIHVQSVAKYLERMGDHAENMAEQVIFLVGGEDVRHIGYRKTSGGVG